MARVSFNLFGAFDVKVGERLINRFHSDRVRGLLAYLVTESERPHDRSHLGQLLWPDWEERRARTYLRHALANLRTRLEDTDTTQPLFLADRSTIQLNEKSAHECDVTAFIADVTISMLEERNGNSAAAAHHWGQAVGRYRAPFLEGFALPDCPAFEVWLLSMRERLQRYLQVACDRLVNYNEALGNYDVALEYAWQRLKHEPTLEEAHCQVMRLLAQTGQRGRAIQQFQRCVRILQEQLSVPPSPQTQQLYERILSDSIHPLDSTVASDANRDPVNELARNNGTSSFSYQASSVTHDLIYSQRHNLPAQLTPLIGRHQEVANVRAHLRSLHGRLITLTGPGGVGKSRLAIEAANGLLSHFEDGIYLVSLSSIRDAVDFDAAVASVLAVDAMGRQTLGERLLAYLGTKSMLLILDNFEHLMPAAQQVAALLAGCPRLHLLITSRQALRLQGEQEIVLSPLALPSTDVVPSAELIHAVPAVRLFVQRAQAIRQTFQLTDANAKSVVGLCVQLDGLPLALELAAAGIRIFSPEMLATHLQNRLNLLQVNAPDRPERHRSLQATMEWSYSLLSEPEQRLFQMLSVFAGGSTLEAVERISKMAGFEQIPPVMALAALVDKSLVQRSNQQDGSDARFTLLETLRSYAHQRLEEDVVVADNVRRAHAQDYLALAEEADQWLEGPEQLLWLDRLMQEQDNLRTVMQWTLDTGETEVGLRLGNALLNYWLRRGGRSEASKWMLALLAHPQGAVSISVRAKALLSTGIMLRIQDTLPSRLYFEEAIALCRQCGDDKTLGRAFTQLSKCASSEGDRQVTYREEALHYAQRAKDEWQIAILLGVNAIQMARSGQLEGAEELAKQGLAQMRSLGDLMGLGWLLFYLGEIAYRSGDNISARHYMAESFEVRRRVASKDEAAFSLLWLGIAATRQSDADAAALLEEALRQLIALENRIQLVAALNLLLALAIEQGKPIAALHLASAVESIHPTVDAAQMFKIPTHVMEKLALIQHLVDSHTITETWQHGTSHALDSSIVRSLFV